MWKFCGQSKSIEQLSNSPLKPFKCIALQLIIQQHYIDDKCIFNLR